MSDCVERPAKQVNRIIIRRLNRFRHLIITLERIHWRADSIEPELTIVLELGGMRFLLIAMNEVTFLQTAMEEYLCIYVFAY
jgi:hypothetical protein